MLLFDSSPTPDIFRAVKRKHWNDMGRVQWDHSFSESAKCSEKLKFLTPWYVRVRIRGKEMLVFWKILRTHKWMIPDRAYTWHQSYQHRWRLLEQIPTIVSQCDLSEWHHPMIKSKISAKGLHNRVGWRPNIILLIHERKVIISIKWKLVWSTVAYSEDSQTSKTNLYTNTGNSIQLLTIFQKISIFDAWLDSEGSYGPLVSAFMITCYFQHEVSQWLNTCPK